jgi:hypothetical protein
MRYGTLAIFLVVVLASPAFAGSDYDDFTITKVTVSDGEILVIGTQESESSSASSIHNAFKLNMSTSVVDQEVLAIALTAFTAGQTLEIGFDTDAPDCVQNAPRIIWVTLK